MSCRFFILVILMSIHHFAKAQPVEATAKTRILFVLDASYSMLKNWGTENRWEIAKRVLGEMADSLQQYDNAEFGLRIFGHQSGTGEHNCRDSRLEIPVGKHKPAEIREKLKSVQPKGITPIVYSIQQCGSDFGNSKGSRNVLILITDGEESCGGDPCKTAEVLRAADVNLRPFVIGLDLPADKFQTLTCMGEYMNAKQPSEFNLYLNNILRESLSRTTFQINLNDEKGKPTETNVPMSFYDRQSGKAVYQLMHTLNSRGLPDTLELDPFITYDLIVHTLPAIRKDQILAKRNSHNTISLPAAQGVLKTSMPGIISKAADTEKIRCIIRKEGSTELVHVMGMNETVKLLTGSYDLEFLTIPRIYSKVTVRDHQTTTAEVALPGMLSLQKQTEVIGILLIKDPESGRLKKVYDLNPAGLYEMVLLQPGKYRLVYRTRQARTIHTSVDKEFEISSGGAIVLKL
jgi:Ca-activated chloride channel family protein